jgi:hypothetical protein
MKRVLSIVLAVTVVACGKEIVGPRSGVTLLVTNGTCLAGHCDSLRVLAFPSDLPETPGGPWVFDLGVMTTSQECFVLPPSANFYVNTTTFTWTTLVPLSLRAQPPSAHVLFASPTTSAFIPANAAGWSITFPKDSVAAPSPSCTP